MAVFEHLPADTKREGEVKFLVKYFWKIVPKASLREKMESGNWKFGAVHLACHKSAALKAAHKMTDGGKLELKEIL